MINDHVFKEGFTQSELSLFSICPQKWNWRYNQLLKKRGAFSFALLVGSAFHSAMEQFYRGEQPTVVTLQFPDGVIPSQRDIETIEYWNVVLPHMVAAYAIYYKDDLLKFNVQSLERELEIEYRGFRIRGKIVLTLQNSDGSWIKDHKTTSKLNRDVVAGWDFRFQFMFYLWLCWKIGEHHKGYYINAVKKPELRIKKNESLQEFGFRVQQDMLFEPEKYFYREAFPITKDALQHFESSVVDHKLTKLTIAKNWPNPSQHPNVIIEDKNTDECQRYGAPCEFIDLCRHGYEKMGGLYEKREHKHEELEKESIE